MSTESIVSGLHAFSVIFFGYSIMLFFIYQKDVKKLQKEKQGLEDENKKLEWFITDNLLIHMNIQTLQAYSVRVMDNYIADSKKFPKNYLYLICEYDRCYKQLKNVVNKELARLASISNSKENNESKSLILIQQKLCQLLNDLEDENKRRKGVVNFIDAPDILFDQARKNAILHGVNVP